MIKLITPILALLLFPSFASAQPLPLTPDLVILEAQFSPSPARPGEAVTIEVRLANHGRHPITEMIELRGEATPDGWSACRRTKGLPAGRETILRFPYLVPAGARGEISFYFTAFCPKEPVEKRGNNSLQATLPLRVADEGRVGMVKEKGIDGAWFIRGVNPRQGETVRGRPFTFALTLLYLGKSPCREVEVSLAPATLGQEGWFEATPFKAQGITPHREVLAKVTITPTYQAPLGVHQFHLYIIVKGHTPFTIKEGPRLAVIQTKESTPLAFMVPKEVLVTVKGEVSKPLLDRLSRVHKLEVLEVRRLGSLQRSLIRLRITDRCRIEEVLEALSRDPAKILPQPNYVYRSCRGKKGDPLQELQYALQALRADDLPSGIDGKGIKIALIDTGIDYLHVDLRGRISEQMDIVGDSNFRRECHGTALAGIIAAQCNNGIGVCGLAPGAQIIAVRACRPIAEGKMAATTTSFWLSQGIDHAIIQNAQVINLSLGGPKDQLIAELIQEALARGIIIVAAAGDKGLPNYPPYPAALPQVIAVAAVDHQGKPYAEGIKGEFIDLCAPGVDIMTTFPGDKYNFATGTSMAAAYVTGGIALLLQQRPDLKPDQVRSLLERSSSDLGPRGKDGLYGWGLLDLKRLLQEANRR